MPTIILNKKEWLLLIIVWLTVQMLFLSANGIVTKGEGQTYIGLANQLASGDWHIQANHYLYAGYFFLLFLLKIAGLSYSWMYGIQLITAFISFVCFIKLTSAIVFSKAAVILSAILFAVCPMYQTWNTYIYTDAMFTHLLIVTIYFLVFSATKKNHSGIIICLLLLPFFRPFGLLFLPAAIVYWILNDSRFYKKHILAFSAYFILLLLFCWYNLSNANGFYYPNHDSEANIICSYPSPLTQFIKHPYKNEEGVIRFYISNPSMTWRLLLYRLYKSFWLTRPFFSARHNLILVINLVIFYGLALTGMISIFIKKKFRKTSYLFSALLIFSAPKMIFCADWDNRIILPLFVFVFLFMSYGVDFIINSVMSKRKPNP